MRYVIVLLLTIVSMSSFAQLADDDEENSFFFGINIGAFKANRKTAIIYNGGYDYHQNGERNEGYYGANYYFNEYNTKIALDNYFKYGYKIVGYANPETIEYQTAFDIGGHAGIKLDESISVYADLNLSKINVKNVFTVEIGNPNDPTLIGEGELEQIAVFGVEKRTNLNVGIQANIYNEDKITSYFNFFANVNNAKLDSNYFRIGERSYQIRHNNYINGQNGSTDVFEARQVPGGVGFGGGAGIGAKYKFNSQFTFDVNYNALYIKTNMYADLKPFGLNHALTFRIIWG